MGTLKTTFIIILFLGNSSAFSQIIRIGTSDSVKLIKQEELKEDGLTFYKNEYSLTIYNKENINFNKKNDYKPTILAGGMKYCEKCKKENYYFNIKKVKNIPSLNKPYQYYSINDVFKHINQLSFGNGYFLINGIYYKNLGMPVE